LSLNFFHYIIMLKQITHILLISFLFSSCEYVNDIFKKEEVIDYTKVDEYATFLDCKDLGKKIQRKKCFHDAVHTYIKTTLDGYHFSSSRAMDDRIIIYLEIGIDSTAFMHKIEMSNEIREALPNLENIIHESIMTFPKLVPAKKNGVFVTSRYKIPVKLEN